jgi:anti-sigma B factor antagonist
MPEAGDAHIAPDASSGWHKRRLPSYLACNEVLAEKTLHKVGFFLGFLAEGGSVQLKLIVRTVDDIVIVDCSGRIVFGEESADLRDTVKMVITQSKRIILNLSGVTYIDSGGLGTLVALYTTARNNGGSIKLANLTQRVGDLLQVTKLVTIFDVYESEEKAIESFRKGAAA